MVYMCKKCGEPFEKDGLQVILHEQCVGHVCPNCLAGGNTIQIVIHRGAPGKDFDLVSIEVNGHK